MICGACDKALPYDREVVAWHLDENCVKLQPKYLFAPNSVFVHPDNIIEFALTLQTIPVVYGFASVLSAGDCIAVQCQGKEYLVKVHDIDGPFDGQGMYICVGKIV